MPLQPMVWTLLCRLPAVVSLPLSFFPPIQLDCRPWDLGKASLSPRAERQCLTHTCACCMDQRTPQIKESTSFCPMLDRSLTLLSVYCSLLFTAFSPVFSPGSLQKASSRKQSVVCVKVHLVEMKVSVVVRWKTMLYWACSNLEEKVFLPCSAPELNWGNYIHYFKQVDFGYLPRFFR
jgi:hypothetical protein